MNDEKGKNIIYEKLKNILSVIFVPPWEKEEEDFGSDNQWSSKALFNKWKSKWGMDDEFSKYFEYLYNSIEKRAKDHLKDNFSEKANLLKLVRLCSLGNFLTVVAYLWWCFAVPRVHIKVEILLAIVAVGILLTILVVFPYAKWIEVKKYQETWARHRVQVDHMQMIMVNFLADVGENVPSSEQRKKFIDDILQTEKDSITTFQELLLTKEKEMTKELFRLKIK